MKRTDLMVDHEAYRQWRNTCPAELLSPLSQISKWLGAAPGPEPAASIPPKTSLPESPISLTRPATVAKGGAAEKIAALLALLDEVDERATEQGAGFDRHCLPGTKAEFRKLLNAHCPVFRHIELSAVANYLSGRCQFRQGQSKHNKGAAIWALFPEYHLKLG